MKQNNDSKTTPQLSEATVSGSAFLNGKSKQDFLDYYWINYIGKTRFLNQKSETEEFFNSLYPSLQNALIIEWFDSVGLLIGIYPNLYGNFVWHLNKSETYKRWSNDLSYESRTEATIKSIENANELYNTKFLTATEADR